MYAFGKNLEQLLSGENYVTGEQLGIGGRALSGIVAVASLGSLVGAAAETPWLASEASDLGTLEGTTTQAIASGSARMDAYRATIGEIVDWVEPAALQKEGTQVCVPKVLQQVLGGKEGATSVLSAMEAQAELSKGYSLEIAAGNLQRSGLAPTAKYLENITIDQLMAEAEQATVMLNVPGSSVRNHAVGVTYDSATNLFNVHDPLLGMIYQQTPEAIGARMVGDAVIGIK
jgi:hypothetical protein